MDKADSLFTNMESFKIYLDRYQQRRYQPWARSTEPLIASLPAAQEEGRVVWKTAWLWSHCRGLLLSETDTRLSHGSCRTSCTHSTMVVMFHFSAPATLKSPKHLQEEDHTLTWLHHPSPFTILAPFTVSLPFAQYSPGQAAM